LKTQTCFQYVSYSLEMRKLRNTLIALLISAGGIYLVSVGNAKPVAPGLKVSVLVSDTGELSFAGPIQRAAARLAVSDLAQARNPVRVEVSFIDVGDTQSQRQRAMARLRAMDTDVVIAPIESQSAEVLVEEISKSPIPMIAPSSLEDDLGTKSAKPWLFRLATSPSQDSYALAELIRKAKPKSTLVVSSLQRISRSQQRSVSFGLAMAGFRVTNLGVKDYKAIQKTSPDALALFSMGESIEFFETLETWAAKVPKLYLVPGNMADYSAYPWAEVLEGAQGISSREEIPAVFRSDLAKAMGNRALTGPRSKAVLGLGKRTYDGLKIASEALLQAKNSTPEALRLAISSFQRDSKPMFDRHGFFDQGEYSIFRYGANGTFSLSSVIAQN
jgi:ABC-type branched-subunit amino acid transport system substrate-binding protein